jgi:hypothetical protein
VLWWSRDLDDLYRGRGSASEGQQLVANDVNTIDGQGVLIGGLKAGIQGD